MCFLCATKKGGIPYQKCKCELSTTAVLNTWGFSKGGGLVRV